MFTTQKNNSNQVAIIKVIVLICLFFFASSSVNAQTDSQLQQETFKINSSLGTLKQINAGVLNIGYAEAGPAAGKP
jgi:hypothetical protein